MDALIAVYNKMIDRLREERLELEERNLFIGKVVEATPAGMVILDFDGYIDHVNPRARELLGFSPASKQRLEDLAHPLGGKMTEVGPGDSGIVSHDGWHRFRVHRGSFMDRGFRREFFLIEDLTGELRASEKSAYEKLIRMMSHEVKNSVGAVRSLLESCRTYATQISADDRADFDDALSVAIARMANLNEFTNSFADVVRIPPPERSRFDLDRLVRDLLLLLEPEMRERRIAVRRDGFAETEVNADKNQLEQVFVNILRNAIESIGSDGTLTIRLDKSAGTRLTVADSGPGIPPELEGKLFTPFLSTKTDGRGIGLTVVHEILTNHGFEFSLRNRTGGGAEFEIRF
jgi:nitrogen fixation/metabolism regulation signal transduction histidine kinase